MRTPIHVMAALLSTAALAAEPTISDLPGILMKLRGCTETRGVFSTETRCRIEKGDLWASVNSDGDLTLFRKRSYGDTTYAHGHNVTDLLRDFAAKINDDRENGKSMLDALGPFLTTQ